MLCCDSAGSLGRFQTRDVPDWGAHTLFAVHCKGVLSQSRTGPPRARRMHLPIVLSPVVIPAKEEKVEGSQAPDAEIKPT